MNEDELLSEDELMHEIVIDDAYQPPLPAGESEWMYIPEGMEVWNVPLGDEVVEVKIVDTQQELSWRELLDTLKDNIEAVLEYTPSDIAREELVDRLEIVLESEQFAGSVYDFDVVCDDRNNVPDAESDEVVVDIYLKPTSELQYIQLNFVGTKTKISFDEIMGPFDPAPEQAKE